MEIEKKYLIRNLPEHLEQYPVRVLIQGYLNTDPVVRVRQDNNTYYLTYKGSGMLAREEYNLPLDHKSFTHLLHKADGTIINKKRYCIPYKDTYTIELDIFDKPYEGLILAEVEFTSIQEAENFDPPNWFDREVTYDPKYHNSTLSRQISRSDS